LNKADQVVPASLPEILEFTRTTIGSAIRQPLEHVFTVSALERLTTNEATRDWSALETYLCRLSITARERLVSRATDRAVARIARRLSHQLAQRQDALRRPIAEIEQRVDRLRRQVSEVDREIIELRFRFDAAEANLGATIEEQRRQFVERTTALSRALAAWIETNAHVGRSLRSHAFEEARRLVTSAIQEWFDRMEPEATRLYRATTEQFIEAANEQIARVAADAADLDVDEMPAEVGFHLRRQFYFTHLMHTTGGTPLTWVVDRFAPASMRRTHVARAADAYLAHLLESNSHRVENDFKDRTRESRRWLEGQVRARQSRTMQEAERALIVARNKQQMSEDTLSATLQRLEDLHSEVAGLAS
jgi:septal ring factor EnvC (AmiA/AmiB activator)